MCISTRRGNFGPLGTLLLSRQRDMATMATSHSLSIGLS
jgi:hypothetical protein